MVVSLDGHCNWLCCIAVLNTMSTQMMEKVMKYLVESFYSDLALEYYIFGPKPIINTERCSANSLFDDFDNLRMVQGLALIS